MFVFQVSSATVSTNFPRKQITVSTVNQWDQSSWTSLSHGSTGPQRAEDDNDLPSDQRMDRQEFSPSLENISFTALSKFKTYQFYVL